ncbi:MAG TPA: lactonase family protein [Anaerolineales bacterium]|nr:lactonase family protein [Anaerolineales bacterium]
MSVTSKNPFVLVGTYTEQEASQSKGIYVYRLDLSLGELTFAWAAGELLNPSYLAIHPQQEFLYTVNEVRSFGGKKGGGVSALSIDSISGRLNLVNSVSSHGEDPCYISVEQKGRFALVANYSSGSVAMFPLQADGRLGHATDIVQHSGSSVHPERQTGPHAHCILPDPTNRFAIAVDLGLDKLLVYEMDLERGKLNRHAEVKIRAGAGPRHITFHPGGQYAYLINELNSTLTTCRYHSEAGLFEELQTVPALPEDFTGENLCADVHISPDGKHLYASNRGHDSIVCFFIDQIDGQLTYRNHTPSGGKEPRNFAIDPTGTFLLAANQKSPNIVTFKIDAESGELSRIGHEVEVSMPVCVQFARLKS